MIRTIDDVRAYEVGMLMESLERTITMYKHRKGKEDEARLSRAKARLLEWQEFMAHCHLS